MFLMSEGVTGYQLKGPLMLKSTREPSNSEKHWTIWYNYYDSYCHTDLPRDCINIPCTLGFSKVCLVLGPYIYLCGGLGNR